MGFIHRVDIIKEEIVHIITFRCLRETKEHGIKDFQSFFITPDGVTGKPFRVPQATNFWMMRSD